MLTTIGDILQAKHRAVQTTRPTETLAQAVGRMAASDTGALPVVEGGRLVGILSKRDVLARVVRDRLDPDTADVAQAMSAHPVSVRPNTRADQAVHLMREKRFRHLPVVEAGQLVGMVSLSDLAARIISDQNDSMNRMIGAIKAIRPVG